MYLNLRFDVHSGTRTHYHSLQTPSRYHLVLLSFFTLNTLNELKDFIKKLFQFCR
ncbi:unnamed protein product [Schistosoma curassoni]|uniref:Ovule protein n=1 Tax=Schistosoma curassoni TaxID=6186 RepID=A0A183KG43_9TREM|nr:unnamed protein product [Schistosoma curassoni]